jgi:hypothetical protein
VTTIVVQYRPRADQADENQRLVEEVFAELDSTDPGGIRYATWRLADGTFVHIANLETDVNPPSSNAAFRRFQQRLRRWLRNGATSRGPTLVPVPRRLVGVQAG